MRRMPQIFGILLALLLAAPLARAQGSQGPIPPPPKFEVHRIPTVPHPGPPPIPQQEIIARFAAKEEAEKKLYDTYNFTQTIRIEEEMDSGGQFTAVGQVYTKPDGSRFWRPTQPLQNTLKFTSFSPDDIQAIVDLPLFFLTTADVPNYDFIYTGQDKLDELNTYVFQVKPKTFSRTHRYFQGAIWVDDHDLSIVESYGKFVTDIDDHNPKLPFAMFDTYRENFQGQYWLPTYTDADDTVDSKGGRIHLKLVVRAADFKLNPAPAQPTPPYSPASH